MSMSFPAFTTVILDRDDEGNAPTGSDHGGPPERALAAPLPDGEHPSRPVADRNGPAIAASAGATPADGDVAAIAAEAEPPAADDIEGEADAELPFRESPLVGPTWSLVEYYGAESNDLVDVAEGSLVTLEFEDDGGLDGPSDCDACSDDNTGPTADSSFADTTVDSSFTAEGPQEVNRQEFACLQNFEGVVDWSISEDGSVLELTDADSGNVLARYSLRVPPLVGPTWKATRMYDASSGALADVPEGDTITFVMENDGRFGGGAGRNNYGGGHCNLTSTSFAVDGPVVGTGTPCDSEEVNEQEAAYFSNFADGREIGWAIMEDGSLELKNLETGDVFATFKAVPEALADQIPFLEQDSVAIAFGTGITAYAMAMVMIPVWVSPCILHV